MWLQENDKIIHKNSESISTDELHHFRGSCTCGQCECNARDKFDEVLNKTLENINTGNIFLPV